MTASKRAGGGGTLDAPGGCSSAFSSPRFSSCGRGSPRKRGQTGDVQRQVVTTNGAVTFIGNALGLNKDGTNDRPGISGSLGTFITTDTSLRDNPEWPQGTTGDWRLNSSSGRSQPSVGEPRHPRGADLGRFLSLRQRRRVRLPERSDQLHDTGRNNPGDARSSDRRHAIRSPAELLRSDSERHEPRHRRGRRHVHGWSRSRDAGDRRSELQRSRLDAGHSLRKRPTLPTRSLSLFLGLEPQGGATASVSGICTPDNNGKLRARVAVSASGGDTPDPGHHSRLASIRSFQQPQSGQLPPVRTQQPGGELLPIAD